LTEGNAGHVGDESWDETCDGVVVGGVFLEMRAVSSENSPEDSSEVFPEPISSQEKPQENPQVGAPSEES
jgi:hypothetical protein